MSETMTTEVKPGDRVLCDGCLTGTLIEKVPGIGKPYYRVAVDGWGQGGQGEIGELKVWSFFDVEPLTDQGDSELGQIDPGPEPCDWLTDRSAASGFDFPPDSEGSGREGLCT